MSVDRGQHAERRSATHCRSTGGLDCGQTNRSQLLAMDPRDALPHADIAVHKVGRASE